MQKFSIRRGLAADVPAVMALVEELALYEKAPLEVTNTAERMLNDGFGAHPQFILWVATMDEKVVGMALCYTRYSTWKGPMLYLEDFYVQEAHRGSGIGHQLFETCLSYGREKEFAGICWQVLEWNEPAIHFYKKYAAQLDAEWVNGKIMF
jgi:GNAT superfamily N-acetyltransferase